MSPVVLAISVAYSAAALDGPVHFLRWEKEVAGIEKRLAASPPEPGGVVFAGSSSIRLWKLADNFPTLAAANVGFGGSEIRDSTFFAPRLILPHKPRTVVFYAGDNDLAKGRTAEQLAADFTAFATAVHATLPKCRIVYIPVKPSTARWKLYETQCAANRLVKDLVATDDRLRYLDVVPVMLGADGKPNPDLLVKDGRHMTPAGYQIWADKLKPLLESK